MSFNKGRKSDIQRVRCRGIFSGRSIGLSLHLLRAIHTSGQNIGGIFLVMVLYLQKSRCAELFASKVMSVDLQLSAQ